MANVKKASNLVLASVGIPFPWFRTTPPLGCLELDGSIISGITYARLYEAMGQFLPAIPGTTLVPVMTSYTAPSGQVWQSGDAAGNEAWRAFDGVITGANFWDSAAACPNWIAYQFSPSAIIGITSVKIRADSSASGMGPKDFTVQGSNDTTNGSDGTWTTLLTKTGETAWGALEERTYALTTTGSYRTYRLYITDTEMSAGLRICEWSLCSASPFFALPDMRDNSLIGWDHVRSIGDYQADAFQGHAHASVNMWTLSGANNVGPGSYPGDQTVWNGGSTTVAGYGTPRIGSKTRPSNICAMWCVKY